MRLLKTLLAGCFILLLAGCGEQLSLAQRSLPFPTPAQHDLIVLAAPGPLTYNEDQAGVASGLEHDMIMAYAQELGVDVKFKVVAPSEIEPQMAGGRAHIAIGWLPTPADPQQIATPPLLHSRDILVQHEASLPIEGREELPGKTVHAIAGSRQLANLRALQKEIPGLQVEEVSDGDIFKLLEKVGNREVALATIDSTLVDIAIQQVPSLQTSLELSGETAIVWWLGKKPNPELLERTNAFVDRAQRDGIMARLEDRYFGHVRRLKQADIVTFLVRTQSLLPKLRRYFHAAQSVSGLDWRLIAAVAYQESKWDPEATSPTNVRGIMMLTEETADRLGVSNRLDPRESILAGARYINLLKDMQAEDIGEPDRTWLALAAYNLGPGHFNAARTIARQVGANPAAWYEMKRVLPLLAQPKYYERLKSGRGRGGEAVILVENIRNYYDILVRHEAPFQPSQAMEGRLARMESEPGLKPRLRAMPGNAKTAALAAEAGFEEPKLPTIGDTYEPPLAGP